MMAGLGGLNPNRIPMPNFNIPLGAPAVPSWADTFSPAFSIASGTYSSISSITKNVGAGREVLVMGDNLTGSAKLAIWGQTTSGNGKLSFCQDATGAAGNIRLFGNNLKAVIDSGQPSSAYIASVLDHGVYGPSVLINVAELWWLAGSTIGCTTSTDGAGLAVAGDTISVHGHDLVKPIRSTSSVTVGSASGTRTFTVASGLNFTSGHVIHIHTNGANGACSMDGTVSSYSGTSLVVNVTRVQGSGTYADWSIYGADYTSIWMVPVNGGAAGQTILASAITDISPYRIQFTSLSGGTWPTGLSNQDYYVSVHNGMGGSYGWSGQLKLSVVDISTYDPSNGAIAGFAGALNFAANTFALTTASPVNGVVNDNTKDFKAAIQDVLTYMTSHSMTAATVTLQAGTYYCSSTYCNMRNIYLQGAGVASTFIQTFTGFSDNWVFQSILDGGYCTRYSDLTITAASGTVNNGVVNGGLWLRMDNVAIDSHTLAIVDVGFGANFSTSRLPFIVNSCTFTGAGLNGQNVPLLASSCSFVQAQLSTMGDPPGPIGIAGNLRVSVTNCTTSDFVPGGTGNNVGAGRFVVFSPATADCVYLAGNKSTNLQGSGTNTNKGEQMFWEVDLADDGGSWALPNGTATGANVTHNTVEVQLSGGDSGNHNAHNMTAAIGQQLEITSGKGKGQWGIITGVSGNIYTIHRDWNVLPDSTSVIASASSPSRTVIYNNDLSTTAGFLTAACMVSFFNCVSFDCIVDGNTGTNMRHAVHLLGGQGGGLGSPSIRGHCNLLMDRNKASGLTGTALGAMEVGGLRYGAIFRDTSISFASDATAISINDGANSLNWDAFDGGLFSGGNTAINISSGTTGDVDCLNVTFDASPNQASSHKCVPTGGGGVSIPGISGPAALGSTAFNNYASS